MYCMYDDEVKRFNNTESSHFYATKAMRYRISKSALFIFLTKNYLQNKQTMHKNEIEKMFLKNAVFCEISMSFLWLLRTRP